jgi:hypothetical protein
MHKFIYSQKLYTEVKVIYILKKQLLTIDLRQRELGLVGR